MRERLQHWQNMCGGKCCYPGKRRTYQDCQCGAARQVRLVCHLCGANLVKRQSPPSRPFWGCDNYPNCCYIQSMADADVQAFIDHSNGVFVIPPSTPEHPRPTVNLNVGTPETEAARHSSQTGRQQQRHQGHSGQHFVTPEQQSRLNPNTGRESTARRNLNFAQQSLGATPTAHRLQDTFIGLDHATVLIRDHEFSRFVNRSDPAHLYHHRNGTNNGHTIPTLSYYENEDRNDRRSGLLYCYWYDNYCTSLIQRPVLGRKPTVLDLFAGAGGMSHGLLQAGFQVPVAVEWDKTAADTLRWNHRNTIVFQQSIQSFLAGIRNGTPNYPNAGFDHIHASPPCQGFSEAKPKPLESDLERNELTKQLVETVRLIRPTTVSMENVHGILNPNHVHYLQWVAAEMLKMDYQVQISLVNARHYGVPQHRLRMILLAAKKGFPLPESPAVLRNRQRVPLSVNEALSDLELIDPVQSGVPVTCQTGHLVFDHIEWKPHHTKSVRLQRGGPAPTLCRRNIIQHYRHDRDLTLRERARLQSFPDDYCFCGSPEEQADQIGNAVPVRLAKAIGDSIMKAYQAHYG